MPNHITNILTITSRVAAYELAFMVRPESREWYELTDGKYKPAEECTE